ncbi:MAG: saccharopine dehydrogenase NADP-binding domain-containing protein [Pseudomonadales bacterium]
MSDREFDVIVWGATGFTGRLVAAHLLERFGASSNFRWALGGRSEARLDEVRAGLGEQAAQVPLVLGDADDQAQLDVIAARTRVVCSAVGPYALHGSKMVAACVHHGTHYCDLTGEVHWMRRMIDSHHQRARETGARIVHTCGFDSIPSDLGTWFLQQEMQRRFGAPAAAVKLRVREMRGGFSGGTIASMLNMMDEAQGDPGIRQVLDDPYGLNPEGERSGLDGPERSLPEYDGDVGAWVTPFVMAAINTKVVRRSNALFGYDYGRDFRYDEGMVMPFGPWGFPLAASLSAGSAAASAAASVGALRRLITPMLPRSGQGPSEQARAAGGYVIDLIGKGSTGGDADLRVTIRGRGDPGYASTSRMLGEAATCLAQDDLRSEGGVLTPAVAMGEALLARLPLHADVTFDVVESG